MNHTPECDRKRCSTYSKAHYLSQLPLSTCRSDRFEKILSVHIASRHRFIGVPKVVSKKAFGTEPKSMAQSENIRILLLKTVSAAHKERDTWPNDIRIRLHRERRSIFRTHQAFLFFPLLFFCIHFRTKLKICT